MSSEALERAQVIRAALMVNGYGSPPRHTVMGQEALAALDALLAEVARLEQALREQDEPTRVIEGIVYDPSLDSGRTAVVTADEHVYIEAELPAEGERVRVVITELRRAADEPGETQA